MPLCFAACSDLIWANFMQLQFTARVQACVNVMAIWTKQSRILSILYAGELLQYTVDIYGFCKTAYIIYNSFHGDLKFLSDIYVNEVVTVVGLAWMDMNLNVWSFYIHDQKLSWEAYLISLIFFFFLVAAFLRGSQTVFAKHKRY